MCFLLLRNGQKKRNRHDMLGIGILFSSPSKSREARTLGSRCWDEHGQQYVNEKETIVIN